MKRKTLVLLFMVLITTIILLSIIKPSFLHLGSGNSVQPLIMNSTQEIESKLSVFDVIWSADFQDQEIGVFNYKDVKKTFGSNGTYFGQTVGGIGFLLKKYPSMKNDQNITIEEENGNKFTRNWFKGGHYGMVAPNRPEGSGHMYYPKIPGKNEEIWISYNIRWPSDRDWALSGKIGIGITGGSSPGGCNPYQKSKHNGFELNLVWSHAQEMKLYLYWSGKNDSLYPCGLSGPFKWDDPYRPGEKLILTNFSNEWHNIALRVVLNDIYIPGKANGIIEAYWDGMMVLGIDTLHLRTEPGVFIDHARSYYNHGGNDDRFAPKRDTYYDCDDVWTWTWEKGSGLPTGFTHWDSTLKVPLPNYPKIN